MHNHNHDTPARPSRTPRRLLAAVALAASLALVAAACGGDDDSAGASADGGPAVTITSPADGAQVGQSFDVVMDLGFEIGEPDTGRQHIHLHYDGSPDYDIVYEDTHTVTSLDAGEHSIVAVVANADHSETDARSKEVTVQVGDDGTTGGGPTGSSPPESPETTPPDASDDGFDY
jgi:hypothetical protein